MPPTGSVFKDLFLSGMFGFSHAVFADHIIQEPDAHMHLPSLDDLFTIYGV